jgi:hypothetical protein
MKSLLATTALLLISTFAQATTTWNCPPPEQIRCVPSVTFLNGWHYNGGQTTGNSFMPNNQCANVIQLAPGQQRLLCCYEKCGVFLRDVRATECAKINESTFDCR